MVKDKSKIIFHDIHLRSMHEPTLSDRLVDIIEPAPKKDSGTHESIELDDKKLKKRRDKWVLVRKRKRS